MQLIKHLTTLTSHRRTSRWARLTVIMAVLTGTLTPGLLQPPIAQAQTEAYCRLSANLVTQKEQLRQAAITGDAQAQRAYQNLLNEHARILGECRMRTWPRTQAIWLRLYPCDAQPGALQRLLDDIVNKGYNEIYVEAFYDGQVLLPVANNPTVWPSVVRTPGMENVDLLAQAMEEGRRRGLKTYAWVFTMNFGYTYAQRPDRQHTLALNGAGETTLSMIADNENLHDQLGESFANHVFVDPYNPQAQRDYQVMIYEILKRRPQGVLFDYVRYPRGVGGASVAGNVKDLWIYGQASQEVILNRALHPKGRELLELYVKNGYLTDDQIKAIREKYPDVKTPLWQDKTALPALEKLEPLPVNNTREQLWFFSVAHAMQGIVDFVKAGALPVQSRGLPAGAVFFPDGNQRVRERGFDSRLQLWDQFPANMEFHPMLYGACGINNTSCIEERLRRVLTMGPANAKIIPALAGLWGQPFSNRPSLERQMQMIRQVAPQINAVSHFAYDWQEIEITKQRKTCNR